MPVFQTNAEFYKRYKFTVEIDGQEFQEARFQTAGPLRGNVQTISHAEGGAGTPQKDPGMVEFPPITLTRGMTSDRALHDWFLQAIDVQRGVRDAALKRSIDIVQRLRAGGEGGAGEEVKRWTLIRAWPKEYQAGDWDNKANEVTINELVIEHHGFDLQESPEAPPQGANLF